MRITFSVYDGKFLLHKDSLQCMTYGCHYFDARSFAFWQERKSYVHDYCLKEKYLSYLIFLVGDIICEPVHGTSGFCVFGEGGFLHC